MHAVGLGGHREHLALAPRNEVDHLRCVFLGYVDGEHLDGLAFHAVDLLDDNLRLANLQLVALAAHGLDQHR